MTRPRIGLALGSGSAPGKFHFRRLRRVRATLASPVGTIIVDPRVEGVLWRHEPHPVPHRTSRPPTPAAGVCRFFPLI
jgi:hypothetical protein